MLAGLRLVSIDNNRPDTFGGEAVGKLIHGWRRHPTVWSGETAEFHRIVDGNVAIFSQYVPNMRLGGHECRLRF
jgi:hypothetical protein